MKSGPEDAGALEVDPAAQRGRPDRAAWFGRVLDEAIERIAPAAVILAGDERVLARNTRAATLFNDGPVRFAADRLEARDMIDAARLAALLRADASPLRVLRFGGRERALTLLAIVPSGFACTLVFASDGGRTPLDLAVLRAEFGLSPTEADIAAALLEGAGTDAIARARGSSRETVRTHVKRVYEKLGVRSHGQAVAVLAGSLSALAGLCPPRPYPVTAGSSSSEPHIRSSP